MEDKQPVWLPHLTNKIIAGSNGWNLSSYLIALEGWKRGLELRWHRSQFSSHVKESHFSLRSNNKSFFFNGSLKSNNSGKYTSSDFFNKRELLHKNGFSFSGQECLVLTPGNLKEVADSAVRIGFPVDLLINTKFASQGARTRIKNEKELHEFLVNYQTNNLPTKIIIKKVCNSRNYRLFVLNNKVISTVEVKRPCVIGDGSKSIKELILLKNEIRNKHPFFKNFLIPIDQELSENLEEDGRSSSTIPDKGEIVYLSKYPCLYTGGETEEVSEVIGKEIIEAALKAVKIFPEINYSCVEVLQSGSEIIVRDIFFDELEVLLFPLKGKAKDIPAAIIDYHFPESNKLKQKDIDFYFEMETVSEALTSGNIQSAKVMQAPTGEIFGSKFTVHGEVLDLRFHQWLKKQAFQLGIHGYIVIKGEKTIEIAAAGKTLENISSFNKLIINYHENINITDIIEEQLTGQIKVGFEIEYEAVRAAKEIEKINDNLQILDEEIREGERKYQQYQKSLSWKLTSPLRSIIDNIKYVRRTIKGVKK